MIQIHHFIMGKGESFDQQYVLQKGMKNLETAEWKQQKIKHTNFTKNNSPNQLIYHNWLKRKIYQSYGSADVFYSENNRNNKSLNVCNGKPTNYYLSWEESKIPTFSLEIILTTAVIHAHEECD